MKKGENLKGKGFDANPNNINKKGRPKTSISQIMEELLQGSTIEYEFVITNSEGEKKVKKGGVTCKGDLKTLLATLHITKAMNDLNTFKEILNRTEGSAVKNIDVTTNGENINSVDLETMSTEELERRAKSIEKLIE